MKVTQSCPIELSGKPSGKKFCSVQLLSHVTPGTVARQASLSIANSRSLLKPMSIESVMSSNYLILCRPKGRTHLPSFFPHSDTVKGTWSNKWPYSLGIRTNIFVRQKGRRENLKSFRILNLCDLILIWPLQWPGPCPLFSFLIISLRKITFSQQNLLFQY